MKKLTQTVGAIHLPNSWNQETDNVKSCNPGLEKRNNSAADEKGARYDYTSALLQRATQARTTRQYQVNTTKINVILS